MFLKPKVNFQSKNRIICFQFYDPKKDEDVEMMDTENLNANRKYQEKEEMQKTQNAKDEDVEMRSDDETGNSSAEDSDEPCGEELEKMVDEYEKQRERRKPILKELFGKRAGNCELTEEELRAAFAERKKYARDLRTFHWINPETNKFYLLPVDRKSEQHFSRFRKELKVCKQESKPGIYLSLPPPPDPETPPSSESDGDMEEIAEDIFPL